jgi:hypothetical protein
MSDFLGGKLDNHEIHKILTEYKFSSGFDPSEKLISSIIEQFWFHDFYNSFLSDQFFLNYLIKYLDKNHSNKFNRYNFYTFLFDQIISNKRARIVLQDFSLVFEKLQTDTILMSELNNLLKLSKFPEDLFPISWLKKNNLIKIEVKENKEYFIWTNHTLTEYLVAEYLLEKNNFLDEFKKFVILKQEGIIAFKPSWTGVLRFLMESKKGTQIITWLIDYLEKHQDNIDDNLAELLVFVVNNTSIEIKKNIFNLIYNTYFERVVWLPIWARQRLSKFIDEEIYKRLEHDIKKWPDQTETFVKRGNVITLIEGLLDNKSKLLNIKRKNFWRKTLINFANKPDDGGNGVLQRDSLSALAYFKDEKIILEVAENCFEKTQDTLVKDEFIQLCYNSAPNSKYAIDYLIKGVKTGTGIYARHGLYKIIDKKAIEYFLSSISEDDQFLKSFLRRESIFDKEDGDQQLIKNIRLIADNKIISLLKKIIFRIFKIGDLYQEEKSNFIKQIVLIISNEDPNFLFEILDEIKKQEDETKSSHLFFDYQETLSILLTPKNVRLYFDKAKSISDRRVDSAIYIAKRINGEIGQSVYEKAVSLKLVEPINDKVDLYWENQEKNRKQKRIDEFLRLLEPSPGKFFPGVFEYYKQNQKEFDEYFKTKKGLKAKGRLIKLAVDEGIKKIDPSKFKVTITNKEESNHHFTWTAAASYFGDMLSIVKIFAPDEIKKHKRQIIDFIPFAFSDDMSQIMDLIPDINDKDFEYVNKAMSDTTDDKRYLIPGTYIYLVGHYAKKGFKLEKAKSILKSFIYDNYVPDYEQRAALENLSFFIDKKDSESKNFLKDIFRKKDIDNKHRNLAQIANSLLISIYEEGSAIEWRFTQLKKPLPFERNRFDGVVHEVGAIENELDSMAFAKPLIQLRDEKYLLKFLDLIDYSFKVSEKNRDKEYLSYVNYLWRIVISFVDGLKENDSFKPLLKIETWVLKQSKYENLNWFKAKIRELRNVYINEISRINQ